MKSIAATFVAVSALVVSTLSFAQNSNQPVTRSQVNAELAAFDSVGYTASGHQLTYPKDIQAAEAKLHARQGGDAAYGGVGDKSVFASGSPTQPFQSRSMFAHH